MRYLTKNELALQTFEDVVAVSKVLLDNGYVTMISQEEKLYIVNFEWSPNHADRNDVAFLNREELEDFIFNVESED